MPETPSSAPKRIFRPDWLFIAAWTIMALFFASQRKYFIGDGIRHVSGMMTQSHPHLGEPRWLLFPALLFGLLKPWMLLGWIHSTAEALTFFACLSALASSLYLAGLNRWLTAAEVSPMRRTAALMAAAFCSVILTLACDTSEPMIPAACCVWILGTLAQKSKASNPSFFHRDLLISVALLSIMILIHQTVFVAFFFLPLAVGWAPLRNKSLWPWLIAIPWIVGGAILGILAGIQHITIADALNRMFLLYRNPIHMTWLRSGFFKGLLLTVLGGFPQAVVSVPGMKGFLYILSGMKQGQANAWDQAGRMILGFMIVWGSALWVIRRRRWDIGIAWLSLFILPLIWNQVYSYHKFYLLFPILLAFAIARLPTRWGLGFALLLMGLNGFPFLHALYEGRAWYTASVPLYQHASPRTYWLTSGWEPDFPYLWPGPTCALLRSLAKPSAAEDKSALTRERTGEFTQCLLHAFCDGDTVWTDDWTPQNSEQIEKTAAFHGLSSEWISTSVWQESNPDATVALSSQRALHSFSPALQKSICEKLQRLQNEPPHA